LNFFNLHNHTEFSFLDGYGTPAQVIERLREIGQDGIALTDHGNIYAHAPFTKSFKKAGLRLVYGCEMYVVNGLSNERGYNHMTVLAKTQEGYSNLLKLVNQSYRQFYYKPRITLKQVIENSRGLVLLSGCFCDGIFIKNKAADQEKLFKDVIQAFKGVEWYLELQPFKDEQEKWDRLAGMAGKHGVPCVVTADCHYPREKDKATHDLMLAINTNKPMSDPDRLKMDYPLFIPSAEDVLARCRAMGKYKDKWIRDTWNVANSCEVELPKTKLISLNISSKEMMERCVAGLKRRGLYKIKEYRDRLEREVAMIDSKNFVDYFIIISDLVTWAKERMLCGPARGSAAGSLACYCLGITEVDPIKHGLLFERFIDTARKELPDIDLDFPSSEREGVIEYLRDKYGVEKTAQIVNFNTYRSKAILQDASRIIGIPVWEYRKASDKIIVRHDGDARLESKLANDAKIIPEVVELFKKYPRLWDSVNLEDQTRGLGKHAAAVIIADDPLEKIGAVNEAGLFSIDKYSAESRGLLKIDVLGVDVLSVLMDVCRSVGMDWNALYSVPLDDAAVFEKVFTPARLVGVFQFEGRAMQQVCRDMRPTTFEHLTHIAALARPGTMQSGETEAYVKKFNSRDKKSGGFFSATLGMILFQEQVMMAMREIGKFSWDDVAIVRSSIGKSHGERPRLDKHHAAFIEGAVSGGVSRDEAEEIWEKCSAGGSYRFNKSHAVSYSILSYWCAWLKARHPAQFYARILKNLIDEAEIKPVLKEWGGPFTPLDLNRSRQFFRADGRELVGGFTNIKGVGEKAADKIVAGQPYEGLEDFRSRVPNGLASKVEEALTNGLDWADIQTLAERHRDEIGKIALTAPLFTVDEAAKKKPPSFVTIGKVLNASLRNSNDPDKVAKRGRPISGYPEYVILKVKDDNEDIWHVYCPHKLTQRSKQELLSLNNKTCLFKLKRSGDINECEKFKVLGGEK
jgi:DNA polymerase III subunit alpha